MFSASKAFVCYQSAAKGKCNIITVGGTLEFPTSGALQLSAVAPPEY